MQDWNEPPSDDEDSGLGTPIAELADLREDPREGFISRIRGGINRRVLVAEAVDFSLTCFFQSFMDYISLIIQSLAGGQDSPARRDVSTGEDSHHER